MKLKFIPKVIYVYIFVFFILPGCGSDFSGDSEGGNGNDVEDNTQNISDKDLIPVEGTADNYFYFSYDDSASTSGVELIKDALIDNRYPKKSWARIWEFLNFEEFPQDETEKIDIFDINMGLWNIPDSDIYELGIYIAAPNIYKNQRQNTVLTLLIDVSGSMDDTVPYNSGVSKVASLIDTVKYGMGYMMNSLKPGDIINVITFNEETETIFNSWEYNSDEELTFKNTINTIRAGGSTDIENGISRAYELANSTYDASKVNRIVMLTDAIANEGELDPTVISQNTRKNYEEGIYFSGLGVGEFFNDEFLNELTEEGKGAYFAIVTPNDIRKAFESRFISLLNVAAKDVQFRMDFPEGLIHTVSNSEEYSTDPSDVERTNFSYNTSQFFLEEFKPDGTVEDFSNEEFILTITYTDPVTNEDIEVVYNKTFSEILGNMEGSIKDAFVVSMLPKLIKQEVTLEEADPFIFLLQNYHSELADEYRDLFRKWYLLHDYSPEE